MVHQVIKLYKKNLNLTGASIQVRGIVTNTHMYALNNLMLYVYGNVNHG
jgi:hypothetical protein